MNDEAKTEAMLAAEARARLEKEVDTVVGYPGLTPEPRRAIAREVCLQAKALVLEFAVTGHEITDADEHLQEYLAPAAALVAAQINAHAQGVTLVHLANREDKRKWIDARQEAVRKLLAENPSWDEPKFLSEVVGPIGKRLSAEEYPNGVAIEQMDEWAARIAKRVNAHLASAAKGDDTHPNCKHKDPYCGLPCAADDEGLCQNCGRDMSLPYEDEDTGAA